MVQSLAVVIFRPRQARSALYERLLTSTLLVRSQTPSGERGHSFVYASADAVVRDRVDDEEIDREARAFQSRMRACLGLDGPPSIIPDNGSPAAVREAIGRMWQTSRYTTMLFEGFIADSRREHAAMFEALDAEFSAQGATVLRSSGRAADYWNAKPRFTAGMRALHGEQATPQGTAVVAGAPALVAEAAERHSALSGTVIVKAPGMGGTGNLVLTRSDAARADRLRTMLARLDADTPVQVEAWHPWRATVGCTFFATGEGVVPLEVCAQTVSAASAGFLGGTSFTGLSIPDREALQGLLLPWAEQVAREGIRGFMGVDVILSDPREAGELRLPESGLAARFVEANMRVNGQNQDRLFTAQLARRHGRDPDLIAHRKVGVRIDDVASRAACAAAIDAALAGVSRPLEATFVPGGLYHVVVECYGAERHSRNDAVLLVAEDVAATDFEAAVTRLARRGWVRA